MDAVDQRIIALLVADARASYADIGAKVSLSAPAVKRRVDRLRSTGVIKGFTVCVAEIWKTTPFMSLLLLAGLAQIPDDYLEAAKVDGARAWQRVKRVILPNMKAAIMVALLFRTLDAFRIFDSIFIMTAGAQGTETLSFLAYRQTITRVMIGLGSAVSVILAILVVLIAVLFVKVFRTDLSQQRGDRK